MKALTRCLSAGVICCSSRQSYTKQLTGGPEHARSTAPHNGSRGIAHLLGIRGLWRLADQLGGQVAPG